MAATAPRIDISMMKPGTSVLTSDGARLGKLKEKTASGSFFKVDVRFQRDYWLSRDDIHETTAEGIILNFGKSELEARKLEHRLRVTRAAVDTVDSNARQAQGQTHGSLRTILFTDVEEHTSMMHRLGDERGRALLREHERLTREALVEHGGSEVKTMGDGFMVSFNSAQRALDCAIALQQSLATHNQASDETIRVRIGINAGEPISEDGDLFGASVIAAARIAAKAKGGEILTANVVRELVAGKGFLFADRGLMELRGFDDPVRIFELNWLEEDDD